jgi:hypothetical protein
MAKTYRSKPIEVEAILFTGDNLEEVQEFCLVNAPSFFQRVEEEDRSDDPEITAQVWDKLHSTWVGVKDGQYIIKGTKGEFYPCDAEVFEQKYEEV